MAFFKNLFSKGDKAKAETAPQPTAPAPGQEPKAKPQPRQQPAAATAPDGQSTTDSIEHLDRTLDLLEKKEDMLSNKIQQEIDKAKDLMTKGNKPGALACMKRKKMFEEELERVANQKTTMDQMKFTLQTAAMNKAVLDAQRKAGSELTAINAGMSAETVEEDMEKAREAMEQAQEVSRMLGEQIDGGVDEDELMDELEALAAVSQPAAKVQQPAAAAKAADKPLVLPTVPTGAIGASKKPVAATTTDEEEAALRELEAQLA